MKRCIPYFTCLFVACFSIAARAASSGDPKLDAALCNAAVHGKPADIKSLVDQGANVNTICSSLDATPLENATHDDIIPNMTALLDAGADINAWSVGEVWRQETALGFAYSVPAMRLLLARQANVNIRNARDGGTPLIWRSEIVRGARTDEAADTYTKIAEMLIDAGANVNGSDKDGMTPLITGIGHKTKSFVAFLLDHGANVNARTTRGVSPVDVAINMERTAPVVDQDPQAFRDIQALLRAHGGVE
jgi:uncharacterized protein